MTHTNEIYIAFDNDNDIRYYWLMKAWKHNNRDFFSDFSFYDAHDINSSRDSSNEESIKSQLRERLNNSKLFVLLVGDSTRYLYKFVKWEIEQAISQNIPIVVVNLNGKRQIDLEKCPSSLLKETAIHVSFNQKIIEHAIGNWIEELNKIKRENKSGPFYYPESKYNSLGL